MLRIVLSAVAGIMGGLLCVFFVEMIGTSIYPLPNGIDTSDSKQIDEYVESLPTAAYALGIFAHVLGAFVAALIGGMVSRKSRLMTGILAGGVILLFTLWNVYDLPLPNTVVIIDIVLTTISVYTGARFGASRIVG